MEWLPDIVMGPLKDGNTGRESRIPETRRLGRAFCPLLASNSEFPFVLSLINDYAASVETIYLAVSGFTAVCFLP